MKLRILGAGGGRIPGQELISFLLDDIILFDSGSVSASLSPTAQLKIKHLFLSHTHLDHLYGLAFILENRLLLDTKTKLKIYGNKEILQNLTNDFFVEGLLPSSLADGRFKALVEFVELIPGEMIDLNDYKVEPFSVNHFAGSLGYFVSDQKDSFIYISDTGPINDNLWEKIKEKKNLKFIIAEVSFPKNLETLALVSKHFTPGLLEDELRKANLHHIPVYLYHLKPAYLDILFQELAEINEFDIRLLKTGDELDVSQIGPKEAHPPKEEDVEIKGKLPHFDFAKDLYLQREMIDSDFGVTFAEGELIFEEGAKGDYMYIIQHGKAEVFRTVMGKKKVLSILGPGDIFGELSVFTNQPRSASVLALSDIRAFAFDRKAFEKLIKENYGIALKIIRMLALRLEEADLQIENLLYKDKESKVVNTLIRAAEDEGIPSDKGFLLRLSSEQLAVRTDLKIKDLKEVLEKLLRSGFIKFKDNSFFIPDLPKLKRLLEYLELKQEFQEHEIPF